LGYVGCSISVLLAQKNKVAAVDIDKNKVKKINNLESPIEDKQIESFLKNKRLNLKAYTSLEEACSLIENIDYFVISTPTNFIETKNTFDTSTIKDVLLQISELDQKASVVIKSTIPIGFTSEMNSLFSHLKIIFSPEFLREGNALHDNLYPDRIIAGGDFQVASNFVDLLCSSAKKDDIKKLIVKSEEAEAIKLFANTFLAMRISFFNELDTFSILNKLSSKSIIDGICLDTRIGDHYNNPSFGYGGYCLPKDSKQLLSQFNNVPQDIIKAIVASNETRKEFIVKHIISRKPKIVGIYRLIMKKGSDNFRESAITDIIQGLKEYAIKIIIYEPLISDEKYMDSQINNNLQDFKTKSDLIISNRNDDDLDDVKDILVTRDIYRNN
jgi:UDPglucose 6-dehydrogenase